MNNLLASLVAPVTYDRLATLRLMLWAGGLLLAAFVLLAVLCCAQAWWAGRQPVRRGKK